MRDQFKGVPRNLLCFRCYQLVFCFLLALMGSCQNPADKSKLLDGPKSADLTPFQTVLNRMSSPLDSMENCYSQKEDWRKGDRFQVLVVPKGQTVDFGHLTLRVEVPVSVIARKGLRSFCTIGFYPANYAASYGIIKSIVIPEKGALVSPDPLFAKAISQARTIKVLVEGTLSASDARRVNEFLSSSLKSSRLQMRKSRSGKVLHERVYNVQLGKKDLRYTALPFLRSGDNCATFIEKLLPQDIVCPTSLPGSCKAQR